MMRIVRRVLGLDRVEIDTSLGDQELHQARVWIATGDFSRARQIMAATEDADTRAFRANALAKWSERPQAIDTWIAQHEEDSNAWLVSGAHLVHWAWDARGSGVASTVSEKAAMTFFERLQLAEAHLANAIALANDPAAYSCAITVAMGAGLGADAAWERFAGATAQAPLHFGAHSAMLDFLCEKWHGSHEAMFEFARTRAATAPRGHPLVSLIADAHVERWFAIDDDAESAAYWAREDVVREVQAACDSLLATSAATSPTTAIAGNTVAFALGMAEDYARAARVFDLIGDRATMLPWAYIGDAGASFGLTRREAKRVTS